MAQEHTSDKSKKIDPNRSFGPNSVLFDCNPYPAFVCDFQTLKCLEANDAAIQKYGYSLEELLTMTVTDLHPGEQIKKAVKHLESLSSDTKAIPSAGWTHQKKDGTCIDVEITPYPVVGYNPKSRFVVARDVTELTREKTAFKEKETEFTEFFDQVPVGYYELDMEGRIIRINQTALEMLGFSAEEMVRKPISNFYSAAPKTDTAIVSGRIERYLKRRDGLTITVVMESRYLKDQEDQIIGLRSTIQDISALKEIEELMIESEQKYKTLTESSFTGVFIQQDDKYVFVNDRYAEMLGYTEREMIGEDHYSFVHPDQVKMIRQRAYKRLKGEAVPKQYEIKRQTKDGKTVWHEIMVSDPITYEGQPAIMGNEIDITEQKQEKEKLEAFTRKLEESNRELQDFAFIASHDLQEPLRKMTSFADRLQTKYHEILDERGRDYLTRMQSAVQRMQALIEGLLLYSRVKTKALPFTPVNLDKVIHEVVSDLKIWIEQIKGHIEIGTMPVIDADPGQIYQLLRNLLSNSLKFREKDNSPLIKIHAEIGNGNGKQESAHESDEQVCHVYIEDNGIGFDEKYTDRIFSIFQRLHGRNEYKGTGIGLSVCKKIVDHYGGNIQAKSTLGKGATFIVTLPVKQAAKEMPDNS